jgi:hypothetical protein
MLQSRAMAAEHPLTDYNAYFETIRPTFIENWAPALVPLSVRSVGLELDLEVAEWLGMSQVELFETWMPEDWTPFDPPPPKPNLDPIEKALDRRIADVGGRAFVRLGSRSPKDAYTQLDPMVTCGAQALERLLACSERVNEDLHLAVSQRYLPHIWVREWCDIKPYEEFRCFMYKRKLLGVSQYIYSDHSQEYDGAYPQIYNYAKTIRDLIWRFFTIFRLRSHMDTVIFDVFVKMNGSVTLLELNPYFDLTDPCLFDWRRDPLKATFRYRGEHGQVEEISVRP